MGKPSQLGMAWGQNPQTIHPLVRGLLPLRPCTEKERKYRMNESEKRDKWLKIRISEREKEVIDTKFRNSGMKNVSDFIRAMIFVGVIVKFSDDDRKQLLRDFSAMSNNINQIARRANTTGKVYPEDIAQIKEGQQKLWQLLNCFLSQLQNAKRSATLQTGARPITAD